MKQIKPKTSKHNIATEKVASKTTLQHSDSKFFDYLDAISFKQKPMSIEAIERLAVELCDWAMNNENALKISQFYVKHGIQRSDYLRWMERCPALKIAHEMGKEAIGNRREIAGLTKKFDAGLVAFSMPHYDPEWRENIEWRSSMKAKEAAEQNNETKIVIMERIPDSPLVPQKPGKEEKRLTPEQVAEKLSRHPEMKYRKSKYD